MNYQSKGSIKERFTLRFADCNDNEGIRQVYESGDFPGDLQVQFLRNPRPYESFEADGEQVLMQVIIDNENGAIAAVGGAVVRQEYVSGQIQKCAYMTGLKVKPEYQKKLLLITEAYKRLEEKLADCAHVYTTILDDNTPAIKLLEKRRKSIPPYIYLGHYMTFCFAGGRKMLDVKVADRSDDKLVDRIKATALPKHSFTPVDYELLGFGDKNWYYYEENGEILAACFVGDQKQYKQYKLCAYGGILKVASHLPTKLFGYPAFPKPGTVVNHGVVSYLYVKDNDKELCKKFIRSVVQTTDYDLYIWGCFENHPLLQSFMELKTVHYGSRLYEVDYKRQYESVEGQELVDAYGTIGVEVALL